MKQTEPASRRWDREPETAADKRFFDLRESGYRGPIDQDGYPVKIKPGSYWEHRQQQVEALERERARRRTAGRAPRPSRER